MRIGIVADASCDLPPDFLRDHHIRILPLTLHLGDDVLVDRRDPEATLHFYTEHLASKGVAARSEAFSAEQIREAFLSDLVLDYDYVFCITIMSSRSLTFENATRASFSILNDYKAVRAARGLGGHFALRVVDSRAVLSGTAVLVAEAAKMVRRGAQPNDIRKRVDELRDHIVGYMVPNDLYYIRKRGMEKGERSVSWLSYAIGSALDIKPVIMGHRGETQPVARVRGYERAVERLFQHAAREIERGITTQHVCISYGGDPHLVRSLPGFAVLAKAAAEKGVELLTSIMSATAALNLGGGCVAIAWGGDPRPFEG